MTMYEGLLHNRKQIEDKEISTANSTKTSGSQVGIERLSNDRDGFRCIDPVTKKITISRDVVFFENPAITAAAEELDDSDSVRDESLDESPTNVTENINHGVVSNDTLESADERAISQE
ncbi:hypothetical protein QE152_g9474 [Popillia japonica]|uniref:Retroviral polymerase SH3-like domain-containing protein n=1 Tax=Popillia japonica TaxID=7064 RepID=A0AAW1LYR2_POPJA